MLTLLRTASVILAAARPASAAAARTAAAGEHAASRAPCARITVIPQYPGIIRIGNIPVLPSTDSRVLVVVNGRLILHDLNSGPVYVNGVPVVSVVPPPYTVVVDTSQCPSG